MYEEIRTSRTFQLQTQRIASLAAALSSIGTSGAARQESPEDRLRYSVAIALTQMRPVGAFGANIDSSFGISGAFLDRRGLVSLRADLGISEHGHETKRTPLRQTVGGRVEVDVRTSHAIVPGSSDAAPRPGRAVRQCRCRSPRVLHREQRGPDRSRLGFGEHDESLGPRVRLDARRRLLRAAHQQPGELLDVSVQYFQGARAEYLAPGSITDLDGGRITIYPMETTTRLLTLRLGARIGL